MFTQNKYSSSRKIAFKGLILLAFFAIWMIHPTFAADGDSSFMTGLSETLNSILKISSWIRIPLAMLAGKLMTNDLVYGTALHMDTYLWQLRVIMKNFANFGLAALVIGSIINQITGKGENPGKIVTNALIAGIGIQVSRFIVGATLDISNILTSTIASFPSSYINNSSLKGTLQTQSAKTMGNFRFKIDESGAIKNVGDNNDIKTEEDIDNILKAITPSYNSVSGPLMFVGMSALRMQDYMTVVQETPKSAKTLSINFLLKLSIGLFYTITLLLLCIANVVRVGFLRIVIALSPILILFFVFKKKLGEDGIAKFLEPSSILSLIFKPVLFTSFISFLLIFVLTMQNVMGTNNHFEVNGVSVQTVGTNSTIQMENLGSFSINGNPFVQIGETTSSIFTDMIIYLATMFLMRMLLKIAITSGNDATSGIMTGVTKWMEDFAKTVPITPGGYGWNQRNGSTNKLIDKAVLSPMDMNKYGSFNDEKARKKIGGWFGDDARIGRSTNDFVKLNKAATKRGDEFFTDTKSMMVERSGGLSISNEYRQKGVESWLKTNASSLKEKGFTGLFKEKETFATYFSNKDNIKALHKLLGGDEKTAPKDYLTFANKQYGNKETE